MQAFAKRIAFVALCLLAAPIVLAFSWHTYVTGPVWWGASYLLYRISLRGERRWLANPLAALTGEVVSLLFVAADHPTSLMLWAEIGVATAVGLWLLVTQSLYAAIAIIAVAAVWIFQSALLVARSEAWSDLWRLSAIQTLMGLIVVGLTVQWMWRTRPSSKLELAAEAFD